MQPAFAMTMSASFQPNPQFVLALRPGEEPFGECAQVKPGAAGHDRQTAPVGNLPKSSPRLAAIFACGKWLVGGGHVDEVMRQPGTFFSGGFGRAQVHSAINSHRVATDNLTAEALAQRQRKRSLSAASGAED